ncbi:hypothetical protein [Biformimicrobium ophioploci]|uniref:hypothetical protein n=1 Tax=Biformimicrobium ophioploci TaxID=3036711 RepID=UPI0025559CB9|nr:hypothetical protein [Microbulbifer sp. NKW57]
MTRLAGCTDPQSWLSEFFTIMELRSVSGLNTGAGLLNRIKLSVQLGCSLVIRDSLGRPVGYLVWAMVNRESLLRLRDFGVYPQYPFEWYEGASALVLDGLLPGRMDLFLKRQLFAAMKKYRVIAFCRSRGLRVKIRRKAIYHSLAPGRLQKESTECQ